jgi:hypothetical protein
MRIFGSGEGCVNPGRFLKIIVHRSCDAPRRRAGGQTRFWNKAYAHRECVKLDPSFFAGLTRRGFHPVDPVNPVLLFSLDI